LASWGGASPGFFRSESASGECAGSVIFFIMTGGWGCVFVRIATIAEFAVFHLRLSSPDTVSSEATQCPAPINRCGPKGVGILNLFSPVSAEKLSSLLQRRVGATARFTTLARRHNVCFVTPWANCAKRDAYEKRHPTTFGR
jgi:hypothetical protein